MDIAAFQRLADADVARLVREKGLRTLGIIVDGTRRWWLLEGGDALEDWETYTYRAGLRHHEIFGLLFDHGIETLIVPMFAPRTFAYRGEEYLKKAIPRMALMVSEPWMRFFHRYRVRLGFYGDYRNYAELAGRFEAAMQETAHYSGRRLFFGMFVEDQDEYLAHLAVEFSARHGRPPDKAELIARYYGEPIAPSMQIFIETAAPRTLRTVPLLSGGEARYMTAVPNMFLDREILRLILHDYLFQRTSPQQGYLPDEVDVGWMRRFYQQNRSQVLGVGIQHEGVWYPYTRIVLPEDPPQAALPPEA